MSAVAEFVTCEKRTDFFRYCSEICVTNVQAKVTTFRERLRKLIKGEKVRYKWLFLSNCSEE